MTWLALDIGGANLKMADGAALAHATPFELWRKPKRLSHELRTLIAEAPDCTHLAVTMTGEICDCFESKSDGVRFILKAVSDAADGRHTRVYRTDGKMVTPQAALSQPLLAAASNWHALARFAARLSRERPAVLIDVGSTTCDIVPLDENGPATQSVTDTQRLATGELVYTGVQRSPVCAVVDSIPYRGQQIPVAQELFATTYDVYLLLKELAEDPTQSNTADGRPATKGAARRRLGRMIAADTENFNHRDAVAIAQSVFEAQSFAISAALQRIVKAMPEPPETFIVSGQGEFLARRVVASLASETPMISLAREIGPACSHCACAYALAVLAREATGP